MNRGGGSFDQGGALLFQRGSNNHNVGEGEWWVDIDGNGLVDYVYNQKDTKSYRVHMNRGGGSFDQGGALLFQRGNNAHDLGEGEWWVDIDGNGLVNYVYNQKGTKSYHANFNLGAGD